MATLSVSAVMPASPEATWAVAADLSRLGEWLTLHEGWRGAVPARLTAGTELISVVRVKGLRSRIYWRVDSYDPPRLLAISGTGVGGLRVVLVLAVRLGPDGDDRAIAAVQAKITGPPTAGPLGAIIARALRGDMRRSADALRGLLE